MGISRPCFCLSTKNGALIIGIIDFVIGSIGLCLLFLQPSDRHMMLQPFQGQLQGSAQFMRPKDLVGETMQFLIEYSLPSLTVFILGLSLISAALTRNHCSAVFSFMLSTVFVAGSLAAVVSLLMVKSNWLGVLPFALFTILQFYFYWVVVEFTRYAWEPNMDEDKDFLVTECSHV